MKILRGNAVKKIIVLLVGGLLILSASAVGAPAGFGAEEFSKERALDHVKYLADTIGPRPLGSPQEKAALAYVAQKLADYGCQVEWQAVDGNKSLNTKSYNVFGRCPGKTEREIIIGAHIDTSGPEIPGADDDGSGVATILELARILCREPHQSTLVFVAFCGEEVGVGSECFVKEYPLKNVALMLQLDMTSDDAPLMLWIDTEHEQSPKWLVSASIDLFHSLGYRNIDYPTHFQSLNKTLGGGAGSDHEPFMEKGIPAIAFVSDITHPIHTSNDSLEYFKAEGLERSGRLILELVNSFDRGQPEEKIGHYMLAMFAERPIFISPAFIITVIALSIGVGVLTIFRTWKRRPDREAEKKIRMSWPKLLVLLFGIVLITFASQWIMQFLKGLRLPWIAHPGLYIALAVLFGVLGIWLALRVTTKWKLRKSSFFYLVRASGYFLGLIALAWLGGGPRLALYPASGLLLVSVAALVPWGWLKGGLWLLAVYLIIRLAVVPEYYQFLYRSLGILFLPAVKTSSMFSLITAAFIAFMIFWAMPYLLGFAAVYRSFPGDLFWLKRFRRPIALIPIGILIIVALGGLYLLPGYTPTWQQEVKVTQKLDVKKNKTLIEFSSADYLRGIAAEINGKKEKIDERNCVHTLDYPLEMDWLKDSVVLKSGMKGTEKVVDLKLKLVFERQPYSVNLTIKPDKEMTVEACNFKYAQAKRTKVTASWYTYPQRILEPTLRLRLPQGTKLEAEVSVTFLETPLSIKCEGKNKHFDHRAVIVRKIQLKDN